MTLLSLFLEIIPLKVKTFTHLLHEDFVSAIWDAFWFIKDYIILVGEFILFAAILHFIFFRNIVCREVFIFLLLKFLLSPFMLIYFFYIFNFDDFSSPNFLILIIMYCFYFLYVFFVLHKEINKYDEIKSNLYTVGVGNLWHKDQSLKAILKRCFSKISNIWFDLRKMSWKDFFFKVILFKVILHLNDVCFLFTIPFFNAFVIRRHFYHLLPQENDEESTKPSALDYEDALLWDSIILKLGFLLLLMIILSFVLVHFREKQKEKR
jgi:Ca2+/Na+ antiporter